jgi:ketosteroid isomerase-like protein
MRATIIAVIFTGLTSTAALSGEAERNAAQTVIEKQFAAFRENRDMEAYSYASPILRQIFPTSDAFMTMVRNKYPMVHHPEHFEFSSAKELANGQVQQDVMIVGQDGKDYVATYTLQQQADGNWLINSVTLKAGGTLST